jgi:hypothetical protein
MVETPNGYGVNMNLVAKATRVIMNSKLEVKLGKLMRICLQLMGMVEKSLIKMKEDQVVDVCKITTKVEDFDEAMLDVQVRVGKFEVRDVLLDGGFGVNIIFESLRKKLILKRLQLTPFWVQMVDQRKVRLIGLSRNLKINLVGCDYKISVIVLNMENGLEAYSMLLG